MEIIKLEYFQVKFKLRVPSLVAYGGGDEVENIIVKLSVSDGTTGWGTIAPDPVVTGEDVDKMHLLLDTDETFSIIQGKDLSCIAEIEYLLLKQLSAFPSVRAGISIALWDALARSMDVPLCRLLGLARTSIPTSITISLLPLDSIKETARYYKEMGFIYPKIKLGGDVEQDVARIRLVREIFGKEIPLRLDANQSYNVENTLRLLEILTTSQIPVEFIEQPTPAHMIFSLKQVTDLSPGIPVMADESCLNSCDVMVITGINAADLINIKLMKCGGIDAARATNYVAQTAGIPAMAGCMDESVISISAALAVCLSHSNFQFADLDGHLDIENDVASGGVKIESGVLFPVEEPGLGVTVKI